MINLSRKIKMSNPNSLTSAGSTSTMAVMDLIPSNSDNTYARSTRGEAAVPFSFSFSFSSALPLRTGPSSCCSPFEYTRSYPIDRRIRNILPYCLLSMQH